MITSTAHIPRIKIGVTFIVFTTISILKSPLTDIVRGAAVAAILTTPSTELALVWPPSSYNFKVTSQLAP
ncbi:hypothetical protein AAHC03_01244 [Spirometra sp. Aus1]